MSAPLETLHDWVISSDFPKLIRAYQADSVTNTSGVGASMRLPAAVVNDRGVLTPEHFEKYMMELQYAVLVAQREGESLQISASIKLLQSTLEQMMESVLCKDPAINQLFEKGKEMGKILRADFQAVYVASGHESGTNGSRFGAK